MARSKLGQLLRNYAPAIPVAYVVAYFSKLITNSWAGRPAPDLMNDIFLGAQAYYMMAGFIVGQWASLRFLTPKPLEEIIREKVN